MKVSPLDLDMVWPGKVRCNSETKIQSYRDLATMCLNLISWSVVFFCVSSKEMLHKSPSMLFVLSTSPSLSEMN
jgi:hypothetical protein